MEERVIAGDHLPGGVILSRVLPTLGQRGVVVVTGVESFRETEGNFSVSAYFEKKSEGGKEAGEGSN